MSKQKFKRVQDISDQEINDAVNILERRLHGMSPDDYFGIIKNFLINFRMVHTYSNEHLIEVGTQGPIPEENLDE